VASEKVDDEDAYVGKIYEIEEVLGDRLATRQHELTRAEP
jgi:hypothetical protein